MKKKNVEKKVICQNCGTENDHNAKKCSNCKKELVVTKVCPRCAKVNEDSVDRCIRCGYSFNSRNRSFIVNLLLSILLVSSLIIINKFDPTAFKGLTNNMKRIAVVGIVLIVIATLTYGHKDIKKFSAEEQIIENNKIFKIRKAFSILLGLLVAGVFIFVCFKYLIK
jgi:uncharacterized membrane protein